MWDDATKKLAVKAIGTVESNLKYDSINYRDPITVGFMQWYGPRAASLLNKIRTENSASWVGVASSLTDDLISGDIWTARYLTNTEGESLRSVLLNNKVIQNQQTVADLEEYAAVATRHGMNINTNTDSFIFFCSMYHQSPKRALEVLRAVGPNSNLDRFHAGALNNRVLRQYRSRYNTVRSIILSRDNSGVDLGDGIQPDPSEPEEGGDPAADDTRPTTPLRTITLAGSQLHIRMDDGTTIVAYPTGREVWTIGGDPSLGAPVPPGAPEPPPPDEPTDPEVPTPPPGENPGVKALAWMMQHREKWRYSQGAGRDNPFKSGYTDCSACVRLAYRLTSGIDPGGYTTPQSKFGTLITTNREQIRNGIGLLPGDLIFYRNYVRAGWPYNHVEMYTGDAQRRTIGQVGSTAPGPSLHPMDRYLNYGKLAVMARRPW